MNNKQKINFAFYVSGCASRLLKLIKKDSKILDNTVLVVNDNAPNLKLKASLTKKKISYVEINYENLKLVSGEKNKYFSKLLLKKFTEHNINYCFCFGRKILTEDLLKKYKNKIINFHPSILPMFPGEKSIDKAKNNNAFLVGNTAHFVDSGIDTGPVIMQSIGYNDATCENILDMQIPMIEQIYKWIISDRLTIKKGAVVIKNANYKQTVFFPNLE